MTPAKVNLFLPLLFVTLVTCGFLLLVGADQVLIDATKSFKYVIVGNHPLPDFLTNPLWFQKYDFLPVSKNNIFIFFFINLPHAFNFYVYGGNQPATLTQISSLTVQIIAFLGLLFLEVFTPVVAGVIVFTFVLDLIAIHKHNFWSQASHTKTISKNLLNRSVKPKPENNHGHKKTPVLGSKN